MNDSTTGKTALVTGGSRGLGKNMALALADQGLDVLITYLNNKDMAQEIVAEIKAKGQKATALQLDVSQALTYDKFFERVQEVLSGFGTKNWISLLITPESAYRYHIPKQQLSSSIRW